MLTHTHTHTHYFHHKTLCYEPLHFITMYPPLFRYVLLLLCALPCPSLMLPCTMCPPYTLPYVPTSPPPYVAVYTPSLMLLCTLPYFAMSLLLFLSFYVPSIAPPAMYPMNPYVIMYPPLCCLHPPYVTMYPPLCCYVHTPWTPFIVICMSLRLNNGIALGTRFLHDVVRAYWYCMVVRTVLRMMMVAEPTHFDRLTNLDRGNRT